MVLKIALEASVMRNLTVKIVSVFVLVFACSAFVNASTVGIVVTGIGGNDDYSEQFGEQGKSIATALRSIADSDQDVVLLQGDAATREAVISALAQYENSSAESFFLMLIGHGSIDAETWRFNLPGPDLTTNDLVASLAPISITQQLVFVGTSASGAVLEILDQPGRIVVTATKSAGELNAVRFPGFVTEAMTSSVADVDRNEILTLAEVYRYANEQTETYFKERNLLASEHARLTGDGPEQYALARLGSLKDAKDDPVVAKLLDERLVLEDRFHELKAQKDAMQKSEFYSTLEPLLLSIARLQLKIDAATGWVGGNE